MLATRRPRLKVALQGSSPGAVHSCHKWLGLWESRTSIIEAFSLRMSCKVRGGGRVRLPQVMIGALGVTHARRSSSCEWGEGEGTALG